MSSEYNSADLVKRVHTPYDNRTDGSSYGGTRATLLDPWGETEPTEIVRWYDIGTGASWICVEARQPSEWHPAELDVWTWVEVAKINTETLPLASAVALVESLARQHTLARLADEDRPLRVAEIPTVEIIGFGPETTGDELLAALNGAIDRAKTSH